MFLSLVVLLLRNSIFDYLNISDTKLIYPFAIYLVVFLINTMPRSYLQGLLRFKGFSLHVAAGPFLRLGFSIFFILLGYRVSGAFFGLTLATLFNFLIGLGLLKKNFSVGNGANLGKYYKKLITFGVAVLVMKASLTVISNVDLILVKHFFSPVEAGIYSATLTIGKIILFGTGILGAVMFPIISDLYAKGEDYYKKFILFFVAQLVLVAGAVAIFHIFPRFITINMFGNAYAPAIAYLSKFSIFTGLFSMVSFVYQFLLAIEKTKANIILFFGVIAQVVAINIFHASLGQIININIVVMLCALVASLAYLKVSINK